jgi:hypothetical protein
MNRCRPPSALLVSLGLVLSLTLTTRASAQEPLEVLWSYDTGG